LFSCLFFFCTTPRQMLPFPAWKKGGCSRSLRTRNVCQTCNIRRQRGLLLHYIHYRLISVIYRLGEWCVSWGRDNDSADKDVLEWCDVGVTRPGKMTLISANSFFAAYVLCRLASPICPKWWWRQCRWLCKSKPPTYRGKNADRIDSHRFVLVFLAFDGFLHAVLTGQWTVVLGL